MCKKKLGKKKQESKTKQKQQQKQQKKRRKRSKRLSVKWKKTNRGSRKEDNSAELFFNVLPQEKSEVRIKKIPSSVSNYIN